MCVSIHMGKGGGEEHLSQKRGQGLTERDTDQKINCNVYIVYIRIEKGERRGREERGEGRRREERGERRGGRGE